MMTVKIFSVRSFVGFAALALVLAGCTPSGPRALLKGKKHLENGDYVAAVEQFKTATTLLATNAAAWNYYGVALQGAGQPVDAANAYHRALDLDRELIEARLNLGMLFMEQNQPDAAKTEFTACTLRRPNEPTAWLKLGLAQLRLREIVPAERSFSAVLTLKTNEAQAYNGLGLARIQRNRPQEAVQFFIAAVQSQPDFAPAILNLATVNQQYLHDDKAALEYFRKYLALTPHPANWNEVNAIVADLEKTSAPTGVAVVAPAPAPAPAPKNVAPAPAAVAEAKPQPKASTPAPHPTLPPRASEAPRPAVAAPAQAVQVPTETKIVAKPVETTARTEPKTAVARESTSAAARPAATAGPKYVSTGVTPLPGETSHPTPEVAPPKPAPVTYIPPSPVNFPRYVYLSPRVPAAGDRSAASQAFVRAQAAEREKKWTAASGYYRQAAALDPSWFEAQYNAAVLAQRLQNYAEACASYETALALKPDSQDARYNFALALKAAGYAPDAAAELKKVLAVKSDEVRAHLALANLCAQSLHDPAQARVHYLKVLELDPKNPRATDIRYWLVANPG
jgi:tetratricopeptide (TPR) repeat protein